MPIISIRVSDEQHDQLKSQADAEGMQLAEYAIKQLFPNEETGPSINTLLDRVKGEIDHLAPDMEFTVPDFFLGQEWRLFPKRLRLNLGREFKKLVDSGDVPGVESVKKNSANLAIYRKKP